MIIQRMVALIIMIIPGLIAAYGWNLMKNSYYSFLAQEGFGWASFFIGITMFLGGVAFIAGYIFYRDKKRRLVQPRFLKKRSKKRSTNV